MLIITLTLVQAIATSASVDASQAMRNSYDAFETYQTQYVAKQVEEHLERYQGSIRFLSYDFEGNRASVVIDGKFKYIYMSPSDRQALDLLLS